MKRCGQCAAENSADARFCNQCGHALQAEAPAFQAKTYTPQHLVERVLSHRSAMQGERKQVTVLFADMAGSTRIAEQLDPEEWHRLLDEFFSILSAEVHRYEGTINQFTGDGIMALFGAPLALEDHAQRAAHAALALNDKLRTFADQQRLERGINPATRMGLNSGEVVVGSIGDDLRMDYTAKGLTVNLAARMEQIAEPGRIYLTSNTAELIRDFFTLRALGPMQVKGRSEAVDVFELTGRTGLSLRLDAAKQRGLTGFAGREEEMTQLLALFEQAKAGLRQLALLSGDGGLGKSRLCFEVVSRLREMGVPVLSCSGVPHAQAEPMQAVREVVLQRFGVTADDAKAQARQKVAGALLMLEQDLRCQLPLLFEFLRIQDAQEPAVNLPPEVRDQKIRALFARICELEPDWLHVLLIEDLHWLDPASQEFFKILLDSTQSTSMFVIMNMRPASLPPWLESQKSLSLIPLQPLSEAAMAQMTTSLLGRAQGMDVLAKRIAAQAAGNPFYIEETVRSLVSQGQLKGNYGAYTLVGEVEHLDIPVSVQAIIAGRVDRLADEDKQLLQIAAVLGPRFDFALLQYVAELAEPALASALEVLERGNYLREDTQSTHRQLEFCHPLVQEVVYAGLLRDRRVQLHRQVAELLEKYFAHTASPRAVPALAHHWSAAQDVLKAAEWSLQASELASGQDASEQIRYCQRVIRLLQPMPAGDKALKMAIQARASLLRISSFFQIEDLDMEQVYDEAVALAEQAEDRYSLAELQISNGVRLLNLSHADKAMQNSGEAMRLVQDIGAQELETRFRIPILFSYFSAGKLREGLEVLDRRDGGAWRQRAMDEENVMSRGFRALMLAFSGQLEAAEAEARSALDVTQQLGLKVSWLSTNLVDILLLRGQQEGLLSLAGQAFEQAMEFGSPMFIEFAHRAMAQARIAAGEPQAAESILLESLDLVAPNSLGYQFASAHFNVLAQAYQAQENYAQAMEYADLAVQQAKRSRQRVWGLRALLRKSQILQLQGDDCMACLDMCDKLIEETGAQLFLADVLVLKSDIASRAGDQAAADHDRQLAAAHWQACQAPARVAQYEVVV